MIYNFHTLHTVHSAQSNKRTNDKWIKKYKYNNRFHSMNFFFLQSNREPDCSMKALFFSYQSDLTTVLYKPVGEQKPASAHWCLLTDNLLLFFFRSTLWMKRSGWILTIHIFFSSCFHSYYTIKIRVPIHWQSQWKPKENSK